MTTREVDLYAASRIKQLQVEWKKIGPVRKNKSEQVWQRFRAACDAFFERFKTRDQVAVQGKLADRETAVSELEALVPAADAVDAAMPEDLYARVQASRARWLQGPELPRHTLAPLSDRVNAALFSLVRTRSTEGRSANVGAGRRSPTRTATTWRRPERSPPVAASHT